MRILADEDMSRSVVESLRSSGHDVLWVRDFARGADDEEVLRLGGEYQRAVLTFDKGMGRAIFVGKLRAATSVVLVRWPDRSDDRLAATVVRAISEVEASNKPFSFMVIEPDRLRTVYLH
jgi:predicted nuclease of predicted toxin-antitoxin system